jgi:hypothetical protein
VSECNSKNVEFHRQIGSQRNSDLLLSKPRIVLEYRIDLIIEIDSGLCLFSSLLASGSNGSRSLIPARSGVSTDFDSYVKSI